MTAFSRSYAGKERTKTSFGYFELILSSEHAIDRSAHLFQNKSRRQAIHHFELIRLTWTDFKSIGLHSFDGDFHHVFHLHDRNAFHIFGLKSPKSAVCVAGGASSNTFTLVFFSCTRRDSVNECRPALVAQ